MKFEELPIDPRILRALHELGFAEMTEIQEKAMPAVLAGSDVIGKSMTGSGKTAAFGVPLLQRVRKGAGVQALVLTPTRELAVQVAEHMRSYAKHIDASICVVYGGVSIEKQVHELRSADVVVGTPGRILDHMSRGTLRLGGIKVFVLDEADRMLDMGFIDDIKRIISALPAERQTLLFSATMPISVIRIAERYMRSPKRVSAQPVVATHILKQFYCDARGDEKISLLVHLLRTEKPELAIVFCRTKRAVDMVAGALQQSGVEAHAIHSDLSQPQRERVLEGFHAGRVHVLVATNVAARGLDITGITHIFNYDVPDDHRDYRHRIGRTARIGREGKAITLVTRDDHDAFRRIVEHNKDIKKMHVESFPPVRFRMPQRRERRGFAGRRGPPRRRPMRGERRPFRRSR